MKSRSPSSATPSSLRESRSAVSNPFKPFRVLFSSDLRFVLRAPADPLGKTHQATLVKKVEKSNLDVFGPPLLHDGDINIILAHSAALMIVMRSLHCPWKVLQSVADLLYSRLRLWDPEAAAFVDSKQSAPGSRYAAQEAFDRKLLETPGLSKMYRVSTWIYRTYHTLFAMYVHFP